MPVQKLNRAIMYRAYPTPEQQVLLSKTFGCVRFVWNHMLTDAQQFLNEAGRFFIPTPAKYKTETVPNSPLSMNLWSPTGLQAPHV